MAPTWRQAYEHAMATVPEGPTGDTTQVNWNQGLLPIREFMCRQIESANYYEDVRLFMDYVEPGHVTPESMASVPLEALLPAFLIGELRTAFFIGFRIYLPFLMIDLIVAVLTTSLGMLMLPSTTISLPLKLIVFVMADGWNLVVQSLLQSFGTGT
jgi:flagellar biosynthetic protein FliP